MQALSRFKFTEVFWICSFTYLLSLSSDKSIINFILSDLQNFFRVTVKLLNETFLVDITIGTSYLFNIIEQ